MRALLVHSSCLLWLLSASPASAVAMEWTFIDDHPGSGGVGYDYSIGTCEVTNAQYAEFLNAVAATDTNGLYSGIGIDSGISRFGEDGSYSYSAVAERERMPVHNVSFFDALRFANWLQNGQSTGTQDATTTEDGAYSFFGPRTFGGRNESAMIVLPTEDEWYKAFRECPNGDVVYPGIGLARFSRREHHCSS